MAQPFANVILLMFFDSETYICSHSVVRVIKLIILNLFKFIYGRIIYDVKHLLVPLSRVELGTY